MDIYIPHQEEIFKICDWRQEGQMNAMHNLPRQLESMDCGTKCRRYNKKKIYYDLQ